MREISRFIRFTYNGSPAYGLLTNDAVEELKGPPFRSVEPTGRSFPLAAVKLLTPCEPSRWLLGDLQWFRAGRSRSEAAMRSRSPLSTSARYAIALPAET